MKRPTGEFSATAGLQDRQENSNQDENRANSKKSYECFPGKNIVVRFELRLEFPVNCPGQQVGRICETIKGIVSHASRVETEIRMNVKHVDVSRGRGLWGGSNSARAIPRFS